ncbi:MAG: DNA-deoxyinosine glycosylase [Granulosicoccus sp.]
MSEHAFSFPPVEGNHVHTLILGTMPGQASLNAVEYYAHPRNALWPILLAHLYQAPISFESATPLDYEERCALIKKNGIALWDVLASCERPGSLDSKIKRSTEVPNDIAKLVARHTELERIICNGRTAQALFKRHIEPSLRHAVAILDKPPYSMTSDAIRVFTLPSTSPAMASLTLAEKYELWSDGLLR